MTDAATKSEQEGYAKNFHKDFFNELKDSEDEKSVAKFKGTYVQSRLGEYVNCILLNTLLKLHQGQSPRTPLKSLADRP